LEYPKQIIDSIYGIDYPLNKFQSVLLHMQERIAKDMAELEKRRKRKNSRKDSGGTGGMAGF